MVAVIYAGMRFVPTYDFRDTIRLFADTFDTMPARLEESFAAHQRFEANASHELLTPPATTRVVLQIAAADPSGEEFAEPVPMLVETNERNITIARSIVHAHHGTVTAHSNPGGGLTVRAKLPPGPG